MGPIIIFGCGGHGRSVADIILLNDPDAQILFVDGAATAGEKVLGFDVLRSIPDSGVFSCIVGIGDNERRKTMFDLVSRKAGLKVISVIARTAHLGHACQVEPGCFIGNSCHLGPEARIGENTILNNACVVDHEVQIGSHCHIGPNATVSGRSRIGDLVFLGVGATIIDRITICSGVVVGAGATVVDDIREPGTYVGTPARKLVR